MSKFIYVFVPNLDGYQWINFDEVFRVTTDDDGEGFILYFKEPNELCWDGNKCHVLPNGECVDFINQLQSVNTRAYSDVRRDTNSKRRR